MSALSLVQATIFCKDILNELLVHNWTYQGVIDATEIFDFQDVADQFSLSGNEYEILVSEIQKMAEVKLSSYNPATGFELNII